MTLKQDFIGTWLVSMLCFGALFLVFGFPNAFESMYFVSVGLLIGYSTANEREKSKSTKTSTPCEV